MISSRFPVKKSHCSLVLGGWGGSLTGLSSLDGFDASENETTNVMDFKEGQWYKIRLRVTEKKIEAWIDDAYANWATPPDAVLLLADWTADGGADGITCAKYNAYCVSDNIYADFDDDHLPDIVFARMTATPDNVAHLVDKAISYELAPPITPSFYENPLLACGWQDERWFQVCTEIVYGYFANVHGKTPVREYAIYDGTPGTFWSTNQNTYMLESYFGPDGLGYLPIDSSHLTDWGGNATRLNADINRGAFIVQHRDHGGETGWSEPDYHIGDLGGLSNDDLTFVFSINCLTGRYDWSSQCFTEAFHRMEHGALGLIAAPYGPYAVFGKVISGMDVVRAIAEVETDSGNRPIENVTITRITIQES